MTLELASSFFICSSMVRPSISGIWISLMRMSGRRERIIWQP